MKKQVLTVALALGVFAVASAQDLTSKKGEKYLPEAGEWAIGFDAMPIVNAVGTLMGGSNAVALTAGGGTKTIYGKMFKDEKTAYRAMVGLNFGTSSVTSKVAKVGSTTNEMVEDKVSTTTNSITLGGGLEMRRGSTRLQGFYGAMLGITFGNGAGSVTNTYGNAISATNPNTTPRTTESKSASVFGLDLQGFLGAEYFVLPKLSLGAEYRWGINFTSTGSTSTTTEQWDTATSAVKTTTTEGGSSSSFGLGNGIASLMVMFHF